MVDNYTPEFMDGSTYRTAPEILRIKNNEISLCEPTVLESLECVYFGDISGSRVTSKKDKVITRMRTQLEEYLKDQVAAGEISPEEAEWMRSQADTESMEFIYQDSLTFDLYKLGGSLAARNITVDGVSAEDQSLLPAQLIEVTENEIFELFKRLNQCEYDSLRAAHTEENNSQPIDSQQDEIEVQNLADLELLINSPASIGSEAAKNSQTEN